MNTSTEHIWRLPGTPEPPDWRLDWDAMAARYPFVQQMAGCPQSPEFHAEGDVFIHTGMVCEALAADPDWRALDAGARAIVFAAAVLHDVAKPLRTKVDELNGQIVSPGHSVTGAYVARELLYCADGDLAPPRLEAREQIAALVRWHGLPLNWDRRASAEMDVLGLSLTVPPRWLALLARADVRGRICPDQDGLIERVALFEVWCEELGCLHGPRAFANAFTRFAYFHRDGLSPDAVLHDDTAFDVTLLSGLPGAGKDAWVTREGGGQPVISLDAIRRDRGIPGDKPQGQVVAAAREQARVYLRNGEPFIWNATNISASMRGPLVTLFAGYRARVRIVYVEVPYATLRRQNTGRPHPVPHAVIEKLLRKWSVPAPVEAYEVTWRESGILG